MKELCLWSTSTLKKLSAVQDAHIPTEIDSQAMIKSDGWLLWRLQQTLNMISSFLVF